MSFLVNIAKSLYYDFKKKDKKALYYYKQCKYDIPYISYRIGSIYLESKKWDKAEYYLKKACNEKSKNAFLFYRLGYALEKQNNYIEAEYYYRKAIEIRKDWAPWKEHYIYCLTKTSKNPNVAQEISSYIQELTSKEALIMKAKLFHSVGQYWQEAETLKYAIKQGSKDVSVHFSLANAYTALKNWDLAIQEYCLCMLLGYTEEDIFYHYAYALEQNGDRENSEIFYEAATSFSQSSIVALHEKYGRDKESAFLLYENLSPSVASRAGKKLEQVFCYSQALECYKTAINEYIYNCGLMSELVGKYEDAIKFYLDAISQSTSNEEVDYWKFRLAYCYEKNGNLEDACQWYEKSVPKDIKGSDSIDVELSASDLQYFPFGYFYHKARRLYESNNPIDACRNYRLTRIHCRYSSSNKITYNRSRTLRLKANYVEFCETQPVSDNVCFFESFSGRKMTCNPYAIFLEMISRKEFTNWTFVWVVESIDSVKKEFQDNKQCIFVVKNSDLYLYFLATAKILINNSTFGAFFSRREDQLYLNTWHGTPWKYMGIDIKSSFMEYANTQRNFLHCTHLLSPNPHTTRILVDRYDIQTLYPGKVLELGYPRIDLTLAQGAREKLRSRLGVAPGKKFVLYMPTFRGVMGEQLEVPAEIVNAAKGLKKLPCHFLFSGHYFYERQFQEEVGRDILSPFDVENNELLAAADILITDYSSVAFDFMATGKEIIYYIYDENEYIESRGLYFSQETFSGKKCYTVDDLISAVKDSLDNEFVQDEKYIECQKEFCLYDDGNVSKKVVNALLNDLNTFNVVNRCDKKVLLFYAGHFSPNGITRSFLNLLHFIDYSKYDVSVIVSSKNIQSDTSRINLFNQLPKNVHVLGFVGGTNYTIDEERVNFKFNKHQYLDSDPMRSLWDSSLKRDFRRLFGFSHFDAIIQFDGYSPYWAGLFASSDSFKCIFLHNTMEGELNAKYPNLENVFRELNRFNRIASVSEALEYENKKFLTTNYSINDEKFCYVENTQDFDRIERLSNAEIDSSIATKIENKVLFVAIGRLSIEKSHNKLINAFVKVYEEFKDIHLLIIGDGSLFSTLLAQINYLHADDYITLVGYVENPYSYLKKADCFVLPSDHEGQPMVLLEAMALSRCIIATDIPSNRGVIERFNYGVLAKNNVNGLADKIKEFLRGKRGINLSFDKSSYNSNCMQQFYDMLLDLKG